MDHNGLFTTILKQYRSMWSGQIISKRKTKSEFSLKTKEVKLQRLIICGFQRYIYSEYKCGGALECLDETNSQPQRNQY